MREDVFEPANEKLGIRKPARVATLGHSFPTHVLEDAIYKALSVKEERLSHHFLRREIASGQEALRNSIEGLYSRNG